MRGKISKRHRNFLPRPQALSSKQDCACRFDAEEDFKKASQLSVVTLQSGDEFSLKCWQTLCDVSRQQFKMVYDRLEIEGLVEQVILQT